MHDCHATVAFHTIGCRLNQAETALMRACFAKAGYREVRFGTACDVCVIHGCAVTARAYKDTRQAARAAARQQPRPFVVAVGCAAVFDGEALMQDGSVDLAVGQAEKLRLPHLLAMHGFPCIAPETGGIVPLFNRTRAIIKVQDGCDFRCAYCVVPGLRGLPQSRPMQDILNELVALSERGCMEFVLTGANLGSYNHGGMRLPHLLERIANLPGVGRVRLSSIEVSTVEHEIADFLAESSVFCRFLHLPLQSGDDRVLNLMGRRYTRSGYLDALSRLIRKAGPLGLGTDVIAGFPGEDDEAFQATCSLIQDLPFTRLHAFAFSPRPGTRAYSLPQPVHGAVVRERMERLRELADKCEADFAQTWLGKQVSVLIEGRSLGNNLGQGWTREYVKVRVANAASCRNKVLEVVPDQVEGACLFACDTRQNKANGTA